MRLDLKTENKIRMEDNLKDKEYCGECNCLVEYYLELKKDVDVTIKNDSIITTEVLQVCSKCGMELFNVKLETKNLKRQFNLYLKKNGYMLPSELKKLKNEMGNNLFKIIDEVEYNHQLKGSLMKNETYELLKKL